jgi:hypothetical protein
MPRFETRPRIRGSAAAIFGGSNLSQESPAKPGRFLVNILLKTGGGLIVYRQE